MKKRYMVFLLTAMTAMAVLSGCGGKKEPETETEIQTTEAATEVITEAPTEPQTEPQTEAAPEPESSMNKTRSLKALVKASDAMSLTVQTERGKELKFNTAGADVQVPGGIQEGSNVTILYKGVISDADTSDAKVLMIRDLDAGETPVTEGEPMTEAEEADPNAGAGQMTGSIEELNAQRIMVRADDGDAYYFAVYEADINLVHGLQVGNYVTVSYFGDVHGPELIAATSIRDNEVGSPEGEAIKGPNPEGEYTYINGVMEDWSNNNIVITTEEGKEITFPVGTASVSMVNGFTYGNYITFECDGASEEEAKKNVLAIYDYDLSGMASDTDSDDEYYEENYEDDGFLDGEEAA